MQTINLENVAPMGIFHEYILEELSRKKLMSNMLCGTKGDEEKVFFTELGSVLNGIYPRSPESPVSEIERAIIISEEETKQAVAFLTFDFKEDDSISPPVFAGVVAHFSIHPDAPEQTSELLIHSFDLFLRSCVEDNENEARLVEHFNRCNKNIHMVFACNLEEHGLRELLRSFTFERMESKEYEAYIRGVDLGRRSSSPVFSEEIEDLAVARFSPVPPQISKLDMFDETMERRLANMGMTCSLVSASGFTQDFPTVLSVMLRDLLFEAYQRVAEPRDFRDETWAVLISSSASGKVVACATLSFQNVYPAALKTRFEAVAPFLQRGGVGRTLFECIMIWARYLVFNDHIVTEGVMQSDCKCFLVAYIYKHGCAPDDSDDQEDDETAESVVYLDDNEHGHGSFLKKIGFVRAQHDFHPETSEIAFQREIYVPVQLAFQREINVPVQNSGAAA